jgi:hypothetical protein
MNVRLAIPLLKLEGWLLFAFGLDAGQLGYSLKTEGNQLASTAVIDFEIACLRQSPENRIHRKGFDKGTSVFYVS